MSTAEKVLGVRKVDVVNDDGTKTRFEMRGLTGRKLLLWCEHLIENKDFDLVCLSTSQPPEVIDLVSPESLGMLITKAWEINFPRAAPVIQASPVLAGRILPVLQRLQGVAYATLQILGGASLQGQLPTESKADAGSGFSTSPSLTSATQSLSADASKPSESLGSSMP